MSTTTVYVNFNVSPVANQPRFTYFQDSAASKTFFWSVVPMLDNQESTTFSFMPVTSPTSGFGFLSPAISGVDISSNPTVSSSGNTAGFTLTNKSSSTDGTRKVSLHIRVTSPQQNGTTYSSFDPQITLQGNG